MKKRKEQQFRKGDRVICVNSNGSCLTEGKCYTIESTFIEVYFKRTVELKGFNEKFSKLRFELNQKQIIEYL
jgi:hypothetical protein